MCRWHVTNESITLGGDYHSSCSRTVSFTMRHRSYKLLNTTVYWQDIKCASRAPDSSQLQTPLQYHTQIMHLAFLVIVVP